MPKQDTPKAGIWCKDERLNRLLEIQLGMCGVSVCVHLEKDHPKASECLLWLVDLDDFPFDTLPTPPEDCGLYGWSRNHETIMAVGDMMRCAWHRPFSMVAFETAICQDLYGTPNPLPQNLLSYSASTQMLSTHSPNSQPIQGLRVVGEGVVAVGEVEIPLTKQEWALFACLWERRGQLTPKHILWEALRATDSGQPPSTNTLEVYICHLRRKLEKPTGRRLIDTKRGVGYVLVETW